MGEINWRYRVMFHSFTVQFFEILLTCLEFYISKNLMQTSFVLSFEVTKVFSNSSACSSSFTFEDWNFFLPIIPPGLVWQMEILSRVLMNVLCLAMKIVFVSLTPLLLFPQFQCFQKWGFFLTVCNTYWLVLSYEELQGIDSFHLSCGKLRNWSKEGMICTWNLLGTKGGFSVLGALQNLLVEMTSGGLFWLHLL